MKEKKKMRENETRNKRGGIYYLSCPLEAVQLPEKKHQVVKEGEKKRAEGRGVVFQQGDADEKKGV